VRPAAAALLLVPLLAGAPAPAAAARQARQARLTLTNGTTLELHGGSEPARIEIDAQQAGV
jgi:hypothetical protein